MAKDTKQVGKSFIIASITCLLFGIIINWISVLTLAINPNLASDAVVKEVIFNSSYIGLKGAMLAGVMAMIMSTVDSFINSTAVIVVHDFCKPLKISLFKSEIFSARIVSLILGIASLGLSLHPGSLLELLIITESFYVPIVIVPFIMASLGFRSTEKSVMIGMMAGITTVLVWDYLLQITVVNSVFLGTVANLIFLMGSHYLLRQKGGWVGIKEPAPLIAIRRQRLLKLERFLWAFANFRLIDIWRKNCPKGDGLVSILGLFVMISIFSSTHTLAVEYRMQYTNLISILYPLTLCASAVLLSYPLWLDGWKSSDALPIFWNMIMFSVLICFSFLLILISNFSDIQLMVFMVNLIILSSLTTWGWALCSIIMGVTITTIFYQNYLSDSQDSLLLSSQFKIIYLLLLVISTLITFLKPKQEYQVLTEEKIGHLSGRIGSQEQQIRQALALREQFIRNISHEYHAPMTGITSTAQTLVEAYEKLTDRQRKEAAEIILRSSARLDAFDANISSLSKLSKADYKLKLEQIEFSNLIHERIELCRKFYEENKEDREFILDIEEKIMIKGDIYYLTQTLDNLIINAITYCSKGKITIKLKRNEKGLSLIVADEGIGIPTNELISIFEEFVVSSRTRTPAGGRGIGLTLCKKVIEVHGGTIIAESDGKKGTIFTITL